MKTTDNNHQHDRKTKMEAKWLTQKSVDILFLRGYQRYVLLCSITLIS